MSVPVLRHTTPAFRTFSGDQALESLTRELARTGSTRAVVFCGASMSRHDVAIRKVEEALGDRFAGRFDGVKEHSPIPAVQEATEFLRKAEADAVIAVGGGSAIVTSRAATILLAENDDVSNLCTRRGPDGKLISPKLAAPKIPQWVVPSTPTTAYAKAGSAVRDPDTGDRLALFDPKTRAQGIFVDPDIVLTAPASLVSSSALNAFAMAVDGLQSGSDDPLADALLEHALRMIATWLPAMNAAPHDPEPRMRLILAALLSGQGSDFVGTGLAQALSHALGPRSTASNGVVEAMLLPHTMRFNLPVTGPAQERIGAALGDTSGVDAVDAVLRAAGVPQRLRDVGVDAAVLPEIVEHARDDWAITRVPRPATPSELADLLANAW